MVCIVTQCTQCTGTQYNTGLTKLSIHYCTLQVTVCHIETCTLRLCCGRAVQGYACSAEDSAIAQYLTYKERGVCPDDWPSTQNMIFVNNCFALPKRRCLTLTSATWKEVSPGASCQWLASWLATSQLAMAGPLALLTAWPLLPCCWWSQGRLYHPVRDTIPCVIAPLE